MAISLMPPKIIGVNPSVLHDASSEEILIRRSFAIHDGESHYLRRTSSIHAGSSIDVIESKLSRLPRFGLNLNPKDRPASLSH